MNIFCLDSDDLFVGFKRVFVEFKRVFGLNRTVGQGCILFVQVFLKRLSR